MSHAAAAGRWDGALLLAAMAAAAAPNWLHGAWLLGPLAVILVALVNAARRGGAGPFAVIGLGALFASSALSAPYVLVGAVAVYGLAALTWPRARAAGGFTPGRARVADVLAALGTGAGAGAVLAVWLLLARPDVSDLAARVPRVGWPALIAIALLFALVNSVVEEVLFRGLLWAGLAESLGSGVSVLVAQAACFGAAHYRGFPRGGSGVALAAVYGLLLGIVRRRTGGILWPVLGHVLPDLAIFLLVALEARSGVGAP